MVPAVSRRGITFTKYAHTLPVGEYWTREDFARVFSVHVSTATYHAERAVAEGLLEKSYGYISNQPGWLYYQKETEEQSADL